MRRFHRKLRDAVEYLVLAVILSALCAYWLIVGRVGLGSRVRVGAGVTYLSRSEDAYSYWIWVGLFLFLGAYTGWRGVWELRGYLRYRRHVRKEEVGKDD